MEIKIDKLTSPEVMELINGHVQSMLKLCPSESVHALPIEGLQSPEITFWTIWEKDDLLGCGALKELDPLHGEVKSMRTVSKHLRKGVAKLMLTHILNEAKRRGYKRISLETGSLDEFEPARKLYTSYGFRYSDPFAEYKEDPNSVFMTMEL